MIYEQKVRPHVHNKTQPTKFIVCRLCLLGAGSGNRTHVTSLEGWNSTIELHPHLPYSFKL